MMTLNELIQIEDDAQEVWVVSPNLHYDMENDDFSEIVSVNLDQKTKYRYILPANVEIEQKLKLYKSKYNLSSEDMENNFLLLTESVFNPFILETGIYNGSKDDCKAYAAPTSNTGINIIAFTAEESKKMALHFSQIWNRYKMCDL